MKPFFILIMFSFVLTNCAGSKNQTASPNPDSVPPMAIITRAQWGWQALTDSIPPHTVNKITVHHGGVYFSPDSDAVAYIRKLQDWSREHKHWIDIPYHYMIDFKGNIYEARPLRFPGDTNTSYDPRGHALICVIGNFEKQQVNELQLNSLAQLTAWLMQKYDIPVDSVKTHKDYAETLCPGKDLYKYFQNGTIRKQILKYFSDK